jgi:hypothetical protein
MEDMSGTQSVRRGVAAVSSGAIVVGAGAAVGVVSAQMSAQWSQEAALEAAAQVAADPVGDLTDPRPVVVTRIEERHVTPEPVVVHRKVYVQVPSQQGVARVQAPRAKAAPRSSTTRSSTTSAPRKQPSRTVVAPAPAAPRAVASAPKATSTTS